MNHTPKFKQTFVDFVVEEHLPYQLTKHGTWYYVQLEKRNMTTMDMVKKIMKTFALTRKKIGIAGLKDKHALTKQWVCFHGNDIKKIGEKLFLHGLENIANVITTWYSSQPLGLHSAILNEFWIRLKYTTPLNPQKKEQLEQTFDRLMQEGFPNYFGEQRFWFTGNNHRIAQDILDGGRKQYTQTEKMFKLQGYTSWLFNKYVEHRINIYDGIHLLHGDLVIDPANHASYLLYQAPNTYAHIAPRKDTWFFVEATSSSPSTLKTSPITWITWPMIWYNTLLSPKNTPAGSYEQWRIKHFWLTEEHLHLYKPYKLFWLRRPLRVIPTQPKRTWQDNDLLVQFTLPKSAYASVVIDLLIEEHT